MLVDGVEGDLDRVNPNDIESISVIKDASAAAIYGGRASFGVILVTTKSGSSDGKVQISYSGRVGWTEPTTSTDYENRGYYHVSLVDQFYIPNNGRRYTSYTEEDMKELWERRNDKTEDPARPWTVLDKRNGQNVYLYYSQYGLVAILVQRQETIAKPQYFHIRRNKQIEILPFGRL